MPYRTVELDSILVLPNRAPIPRDWVGGSAPGAADLAAGIVGHAGGSHITETAYLKQIRPCSWAAPKAMNRILTPPASRDCQVPVPGRQKSSGTWAT
jgi:hypothetical protein